MNPVFPGNYTRFVLLILAVGFLGLLWKGGSSSRPSDASKSLHYTSGSMPQEAYVWQRHWSDDVKSAVAWADGRVENFCILAGELEWRGQRASIIHPEIDWHLLSRLRSGISLAWRIPIFKDRPYWDDEVQQVLEESLELRLSQAAKLGIRLHEIQLDYDCPTRLLGEYEKRVRYLKQKHPEITWVITALPAWLDDQKMAYLAAATDGLVLQVHWLHRGFDGQPKIMDDKLTRLAIEKCAMLPTRVHFRVALPTYGNAVVMDKSGAWLDILAEEPPILSPDSFLVEVSSDPAQMVAIIQEWEKQRPGNFEGIIWYRLPVEGEMRNWGRQTFESALRGQKPVSNFVVELSKKDEGYVELVLVNKGNADGEAPKEIVVENVNHLAADGANHYSIEETGSGLRWSRKYPLILKAGQVLLIGWMREEDNGVAGPSVKVSF